MMGSGERGVSICFTTWTAGAVRFETLNEIAWPIVPTGTIRLTLSGEVWPAVGRSSGQACLVSGGRDGRRRLLAEPELGLVAPHPVQDDASDRPPRGGPASKLVQGRPLLHG